MIYRDLNVVHFGYNTSFHLYSLKNYVLSNNNNKYQIVDPDFEGIEFGPSARKRKIISLFLGTNQLSNELVLSC